MEQLRPLIDRSARTCRRWVPAAMGMLVALAGASPSVAASSDRVAIAQVVDRYFAALNTADAGKIVELYSDDGVFLQPGAATWAGKAAIGAAYATLFASSKVEATVHLTEVVVASPEWAFGRALADGTITNRKTGVRQDGPTQELFVFSRHKGEGWRIARFAFSTTTSRVAKP